MDIRAAFYVCGADPQGRMLARLIQTPPFGEGGYEQKLVLSNAVFALPVQETYPWDIDRNIRKPLHFGFLRNAEKPPELPTLSVGDVVVVQCLRGLPDDILGEDADTVEVSGVQVVALGLGEADAVQKVIDIVPDGRNFWCLTGEGSIAHDADGVRASREPHEALVLVWRGEGGLTGCVLASTGGWFFHCDGNDAEESGIDVGDQSGVFLFSDGKPWSYGDGVWEDYNSGIDGNLVPATLGDIEKFGHTVESMRQEVVDILELDEDQDPWVFLQGQGAVLPWAPEQTAAP